MKKKVLPLAIAAAMAPGFAAAADTSGYVDIIYTITDDNSGTPSTTEGKFDTSGELDFSASPADGVMTRVDVDVMKSDGTGDSAELEQAFFAWGAMDGLTVIGGLFNNPIGMEAQDAPEMWGTNGGVVGNILDNQTARYSNNVEGLAVAGDVGPATITAAYLNDMGETNDENSFALVANASPMEGLDLELGFATQADQADNANSAEDITNFNVSYMIPGVDGLSVALDYLTTGKIIDSAYEFMIDYSYNEFGAGFRIENVSWEDGSQDSERTTFHVSYQAASNLTAVLEVADGDDANPMNAITGIQADSLTTLELIATF